MKKNPPKEPALKLPRFKTVTIELENDVVAWLLNKTINAILHEELWREEIKQERERKKKKA